MLFSLIICLLNNYFLWLVSPVCVAPSSSNVVSDYSPSSSLMCNWSKAEQCNIDEYRDLNSTSVPSEREREGERERERDRERERGGGRERERIHVYMGVNLVTDFGTLTCIVGVIVASADLLHLQVSQNAAEDDIVNNRTQLAYCTAD